MAISNVVLVLLLAGVADAVFDGFVRNFRIASKNTTHVTFTWDLESAYISYVNYYRIFYRASYPGIGSYGASSSYTASPSRVSRINSGETFTFITTVTSFTSYSQYIMWLRVDITITPSYLYSEQIYEEFGTQVAIELNIKLWNEQTCHSFTQQSTGIAGDIGNEVYRAIRIYCRCTYDFISDISVFAEYLSCPSPGNVTFRGYVRSTDSTKDPSKLVRALNTWLQDTNNNTIIIYGKKYEVEAGPCGVTVPYTNAPFCAANTPTTAQLSNNVGSSQTSPLDNNTAVIVASVFAAMFFILSLGLLAYILAIKRPARTMSKPTTGAAGNMTRTKPYLASINVPAPNKPPNKENIELEEYEEIYDEMQN